MSQSQISEIAQRVGFKGTPNHKIAESSPASLPVIDNSVRSQPSIRTSVDCYVSGQYVGRNGKTMEYTQRYTIYVAYSRETQLQTMNEVRARIASDFESKYGQTFNVTNIFVPMLLAPPDAVQSDPMQLYHGTDMARSLTRYEKIRWDIGAEHLKSGINIRSIKSRYKVR